MYISSCQAYPRLLASPLPRSVTYNPLSECRIFPWKGQNKQEKELGFLLFHSLPLPPPDSFPPPFHPSPGKGYWKVVRAVLCIRVCARGGGRAPCCQPPHPHAPPFCPDWPISCTHIDTHQSCTRIPEQGPHRGHLDWLGTANFSSSGQVALPSLSYHCPTPIPLLIRSCCLLMLFSHPSVLSSTCFYDCTTSISLCPCPLSIWSPFCVSTPPFRFLFLPH